jgi:sucrose phosphorylase
MSETNENQATTGCTDLPSGVMFNAYPDSIGRNLADTVGLLSRPDFKDVFSLFYILPTVFHSDLDRGFSVIDYDLNEELVTRRDLEALDALGIGFKFDLVLNHLSVNSPQFRDLLERGEQSEYRDFFIDWNGFWDSHGEPGPDEYVIPKPEHLDKLFMRKPGLPILMVRFPDGSERPYWNTFYHEISYPEITAESLLEEVGRERLTPADAEQIALVVNTALQQIDPLMVGVMSSAEKIGRVDLGDHAHLKDEIVGYVERQRQYLGQMDLNARSPKVWEFYDETLGKLRGHGGRLIRLDAFAYLHKLPGESNFFNKPGTWDYLARIRELADKHGLVLLPEIHSQYGNGLHEEVAGEGYAVYDFFFPGLVIHALEQGTNRNLLRWIRELLEKGIRTVNMLGCHDGIPILDLKGKPDGEESQGGLISDEEIDSVVDIVMERGGRVKNLYGPDGKKIAYYQVNATFFSALGEDERKLLLARAIQMFMPGIPQVWYLDLFAGRNDYAATDHAGTAGHKEINRTTLSTNDVKAGLERKIVQDQLALMRLRNTSPAFQGKLSIESTEEHRLRLTWKHGECVATLDADLKSHGFQIAYTDEKILTFA